MKIVQYYVPQYAVNHSVDQLDPALDGVSGQPSLGLGISDLKHW